MQKKTTPGFRLACAAMSLVLHVAPMFSWLVIPARVAEARVTPMSLLLQQMHKPNMLVVLDTSGSMNGVAGSLFTYPSEVGVDCDNGINCRNWSAAAGTCSASGRSCNDDASCQSKYCKVGMGGCTADADCPTQGFCDKGGAPCQNDVDCTVQAVGSCNNSGTYCDIQTNCPPRKQCLETGGECDNPGSACKAGWCQVSKVGCTSDRQCPVKNNGGCTQGGTPAGGCTTDDNCPISTKCTTGETCTSHADCPVIVVGTCRLSGKVCTSTSDCGTGETGQNDNAPDTCKIPSNRCEGVPNLCNPEYYLCQFSAGNTCLEVVNTCKPVGNFCNIPTTNACLQPTVGEYCQNGIQTPGALKMCQTAQSLCNTGADCPSGDTCGMPTSRTVIAKRTLAKIIADNHNLVNLGLMTFHQNGYFPYMKVTTPTTQRQTVFLSTLQMGIDCFKNGPTKQCSYNGVTYDLRSTNNSAYDVRRNKNTTVREDAPYCGTVCTVGGASGWYVGSYYEADIQVDLPTGTLSTQNTYGGESITIGADTYNYYDPRPDYYNGAPAPPISGPDCAAGICSATCGSRWDTQLSPFINPTQTSAEAKVTAVKMMEWMKSASEGGLLTYGGTPTGCALMNSATNSRNSSAYHYMKDLKGSDEKLCRLNYVLLISDGEPNGPGDTGCADAACSDDDPESAGCTCRSVLAAYRMRKDLDVKTIVVGFSSDVALGAARLINDNIAKAGGTDMGFDDQSPYAYLAANETELVRSLEEAVLEAVRGSYSTAPATSSSGTQLSTSVRAGNLALDARVNFPSWDGHLIAWDLRQSPPLLAWDAHRELELMSWWKRRIYIGTRDGNAVQVRVDPINKTVTNKQTLFELGLGASPDEAQAMIKFAMGDPESGNPNILGAMINSTPIDVSQPGNNPLPGGNAFYKTYIDRIPLTYVGASDGMLHAFFTSDITVQGELHRAGSEAFAYIPPSQLDTLRKLYVLGGQPANPRDHVFGLANSPKVKNVCVSNCTDANTALWKTLLVMNEGYGGAGLFMLDVTNPVTKDGFAEPPILPVWHSDNSDLATSYAASVGESISVPGFYFNNTLNKDDFRVVFASGYAVDPAATKQGRRIVSASVRAGTILGTSDLVPSTTCNVQSLTALTDVATEKNYFKSGDAALRRAFVGDTWGNLWQFDGTVASNLKAFGCEHPLHFSPTVVQLDRDDNSNNPGHTFIVQVTNSSLDGDTMGFAPSRMVVMKRVADDTGQITSDQTFGTNGVVDLQVGTLELCAATDTQKACTTKLPLTARPASTPTAILKADGSGFQILSTWYAADAKGCTKGDSWLNIHEVSATGVSLVQALHLAKEPVSGPVIAGGRIFLVGSDGIVDIAASLSATYRAGIASPNADVGTGIYQRLNWVELED